MKRSFLWGEVQKEGRLIGLPGVWYVSLASLGGWGLLM